MHGSAGLHSAMAIKRQRRLREQAKRRAIERERRLSSRTDSIDSMEHLPTAETCQSHAPPDHRLATSIGMLHIGVCFLVLGLFLIGSGLLPDDMMQWRTGGWWNELVGTGIFVAALGIFLIILNRVMSRKEEEDLNEYVQTQLTRSRSGHRLERDAETGCLTTKNHRRCMEKKRENKERGFDDITTPTTPTTTTVPIHSPNANTIITTTTTTTTPPLQNLIIQNGDATTHLEKIIEEDSLEKNEDDRINKHAYEYRETISTTTTASLSPGTPSETRDLLTTARQYSFNSRQY